MSSGGSTSAGGGSQTAGASGSNGIAPIHEGFVPPVDRSWGYDYTAAAMSPDGRLAFSAAGVGKRKTEWYVHAVRYGEVRPDSISGAPVFPPKGSDRPLLSEPKVLKPADTGAWWAHTFFSVNNQCGQVQNPRPFQRGGVLHHRYYLNAFTHRQKGEKVNGDPDETRLGMAKIEVEVRDPFGEAEVVDTKIGPFADIKDTRGTVYPHLNATASAGGDGRPVILFFEHGLNGLDVYAMIHRNGDSAEGWSPPVALAALNSSRFDGQDVKDLFPIARKPLKRLVVPDIHAHVRPEWKTLGPGDEVHSAYPWISADAATLTLGMIQSSNFMKEVAVVDRDRPTFARGGFSVVGAETGYRLQYSDSISDVLGYLRRVNTTFFTAATGFWSPFPDLGSRFPLPVHSTGQGQVYFSLQGTRHGDAFEETGIFKRSKKGKPYAEISVGQFRGHRFYSEMAETVVGLVGGTKSNEVNFSHTVAVNGDIGILREGAKFPFRHFEKRDFERYALAGLGRTSQAVVFDRKAWVDFHNPDTGRLSTLSAMPTFSVHFWLRIRENSNEEINLISNRNFRIRLSCDRKIIAKVRTSSGWRESPPLGEPLPVEPPFQYGTSEELDDYGETLRWSHILVTYDGKEFVLYTGGFKTASHAFETDADARTDDEGPLYVGPYDADKNRPSLLMMDRVGVKAGIIRRDERQAIAFLRNLPGILDPLPFEAPVGIESLVAGIRPFDAEKLTPEIVRLGKDLFGDKILSGERTISCATCHVPGKGFSDGRRLPIGGGARHTPSLINVGFFQRGFFWDGSTLDLENQVVKPIVNPEEMAAPSLSAIVGRLVSGSYRQRFRSVFDSDPTIPLLATALAAYVRTIVAGGSPYDLVKAGVLAEDRLAADVRLGRRLFEGKARCIGCHSGPHLSDGAFHNSGFFPNDSDRGRCVISGNTLECGAFKTPSLRNLADTAPYFHNGSIATLDEVVRKYNEGGDPDVENRDPAMVPLRLSADEQRALVRFLEVGLAAPVREGIP